MKDEVLRSVVARRAVGLLLTLCLALAACGQRGPLRLPAPAAGATSASAPASSPTPTP